MEKKLTLLFTIDIALLHGSQSRNIVITFTSLLAPLLSADQLI